MNNILLIVLSVVIITIIIVFIIQSYSSFTKTSNFFPVVQTVKPVEEQKIENDEFLKSYNDLEKRLEKDKKVEYDWSENNTLESMILKPCLTNEWNGRLTCYTAPAWWYPEKKYNPNDWKVKNYLQRYNPVYNYIGNTQDMFWNFESVKNQNGLF